MADLSHSSVHQMLSRRRARSAATARQIHKSAPRPGAQVSIILLDWSVRETLHTLTWLSRQHASRDSYELIWIDLYHRVPPEALEHADIVVTLGQRGLYHKHFGYNVGLLLASGSLVCVCDSDAVFPPEFIDSIAAAFDDGSSDGRRLVLMHHEYRSPARYPPDLADASECRGNRWKWWDLQHNAGACMTVRKADAITFGGFDEHPSFRGYLCGPYDLGWRLVNAGLEQVWHDPSVALWHFAHPDPVCVNGCEVSLARLLENSHPHVDLHALSAVEAFSSGKVLPQQECPEIFERRMASRRVGSEYERKYATLPVGQGFSRAEKTRLRGRLLVHIAAKWCRWTSRRILGEATWAWLKLKLKSTANQRGVTATGINAGASIQ